MVVKVVIGLPSYHNTLVDLIFVSKVNIPNLSLLPCLEVTGHTDGRKKSLIGATSLHKNTTTILTTTQNNLKIIGC